MYEIYFIYFVFQTRPRGQHTTAIDPVIQSEVMTMVQIMEQQPSTSQTTVTRATVSYTIL